MIRFIASNKKILIAFLVLTVVFVLLSPEIKENPRYHFLEKPITSVIHILQSGLSFVSNGIYSIWNGYVDLIKVGEENERLNEEIRQLRSEIVSLQENALEYERLSDLLKMKDSLDVEVITARIVAKDPTNWFSAVVINKGEKDGIKPHMGVVTADGVVGRIVKTSAHYSRILLLSDRNSAIAGIVQNTRDEGIVAGRDGRRMMLKYIMIDSNIQEGDLILTSGTDGAFPPGIAIGRVSRVISPKNALFHSIELVPEVSLLKVKEIMVLKVPQPPEIRMLLEEELK